MREISHGSLVCGVILVLAIVFTLDHMEITRGIFGILVAQCLISLATYLLLLGKVRNE